MALLPISGMYSAVYSTRLGRAVIPTRRGAPSYFLPADLLYCGQRGATCDVACSELKLGNVHNFVDHRIPCLSTMHPSILPGSKANWVQHCTVIAPKCKISSI
jgi:hypothetical protein